VRWARSLRAKIATLKTNPLRCPVDPDSEFYGEQVRVLLYGKRHGMYRVLFAIRGDAVHILTVRHAAQQSLAEEMTEPESDHEEPRVH
jgi:plasmid stabilization system protein ParE